MTAPRVRLLLPLLVLSFAFAPAAGAWTFAVSGDSRNCGDVVMPAIAAKAKAAGAEFYWHLGDLRKIMDFDEDIQRRADRPAPASLEAYQAMAWDDFEESQVKPFAPMPFYLGIGNHETIAPKSREAFVARFTGLLDAPALRAQRLTDDPTAAAPRTYYHWRRGPVEFLFLDNATAEQFDDAQLAWFDAALSSAVASAQVKTIIVGMHEALPHSLSSDHSMDQSPRGVESGERVYRALLDARKRGKNVYVLASHSHYFMEGIFDTDYWRSQGGVLPGWIVGTAGAFRYKLPADASRARQAKEAVYGFLLGTVRSDGSVRFRFRPLRPGDVPAVTAARFQPGLVRWCFEENRKGAPGAKPF